MTESIFTTGACHGVFLHIGGRKGGEKRSNKRRHLNEKEELETGSGNCHMCGIIKWMYGRKRTEKNTGRKEGQVVNIYCWNDEFKEIYDKYASDLAKKHDVEVNFVIISSDNNAYQINLDEALKEQNTCIDDDKVDLFLIEADYASKYVKSDNSIDVKKTVGLTDEDLKQQYDYTKKIVSENGIQKGVTWQATPGLFAYRRSIAKKVLGTDDPDQVQKQLKDWDKFDQVAQKMNAAGYKMLSGYDDSYRAFSNNVSHPWVVGNKIVIDENIKKWIRQTKEYAQKDYNNHTTLWSPQWTQDQGPDGNVFGFFYSTWGINFTLMGNALADSSKPAEKGNGIYGDYAVCEGPQAYYWGGTWMCAAQGTDNIPFIRDLMKRLTCDIKTMKQITLDTQDYTNNEKAMDEIAKSNYQSDFLGGQNHIALFAEAAKKIDMSNISDYDKDCNEQIQQCLHPYFEGKISLAQGMDDFYKKMEQLHPELSH